MADETSVGGISANVTANIGDFISKFDQVNEKTNVVSQNVIKNLEQMSAAMGNAGGQGIEFKAPSVEGFNRVSDAVRNTTKELGLMDEGFSKIKSHISWLATAAIIATPIAAVKSIADIEQQMAGMIQTLPQLHNNQEAVNEVSRQFIGIAEQYGMEVDKIIEAGKLWSRGYKNVSDVMALTGLSAKLAIADMMDVGLANRAVESVINSYGRQADAVSFATHVVDSWTNVAHNSQTSATDLAEALMRSAAAAHVVGVDFDTTTALAATMIKTTGQQGGMIGNALKSIFSSIHSDKAIADLKSLGIEVYKFDADGTAHFRNVASVMTDLMLKTHETSQDMQKDLEHIAGGKFQWGRAAAMFGDYADFIKTYNLSINSSGFSEGQVAAQMDTINRKIQQVKASMDGLLVNAGNSGLTQGIKSMLDSINNFLKGLQQIPAWVYKAIGVTAEMGAGLFLVSKTLTFLNTGLIGLRTALASTVPAKVADAAASTAETAALEADTVATNANTIAKGRLAVVTTAATGGMNLIVGALTAAAIGGSIYAASLGSASAETQNTLQKNEDLIAVKKQELEMNKQQTEFIGTLGDAYIQLQQDLADTGDDATKYAQINKDLGATEDELAKIVGQDGLDRIKTSDDVNEAIANEQRIHAEKAVNIQTSLDNIVSTQKELRDNTVKYCNDRIDAINNEAVDFDKAADAIGKALGRIQKIMFEYYRGKAAYYTDMANGVDKEGNAIPGENYIGNLEPVGEGTDNQYREIANQANADADAIKAAAIAVAVNQSKEALNLGGHWYPSGDGSRVGGDETTPVEPKAGRGTNGGGGSSNTKTPADREQEFYRKMVGQEVTKMFDDAKIATDKYSTALDLLNAKETVFGASTDTAAQRQELMKNRITELFATVIEYSDAAGEYEQKAQDIIDKNADLKAALDKQKLSWQDMTKEEKKAFIESYMDYKEDQQTMLKLIDLAEKLRTKASEVAKEGNKLGASTVTTTLSDQKKIYDEAVKNNNLDQEDSIAKLGNNYTKDTEDLIKLATAYKNLAEAKKYQQWVEKNNPKGKNSTEYKEVTTTIDKLNNQITKLNDKTLVIRQSMADLFKGMASGTTSFRQWWNNQWIALADEAIEQIWRVNTAGRSSSLFGSIFGGLFGGGSGSGNKASFGGNTAAISNALLPTGFKFAGGGHVEGEGTGTSDSIWARVSNGEYVNKAETVKKYGVGFFDALNNNKIPKFADGGVVSATPFTPTNYPIVPDASVMQSNNTNTQTIHIGGFNPTIQAAPGTDVKTILVATRKQFNDEFIPKLIDAARNNTAARTAIKGVTR